ncbi:type II toxin-antitoxin system VapC family toxin [Methylogaea oryzae]|uniref:type II toxin-antitoxin system VapC family toxin n=1 Tax=Methylogaea oryzae TaxID=1295382 RepID=UPI000ABBC40E|nr:type II toxin-antitoxin system VapC family toxin [Methylogaea oryzae]
MIARAEAKGWLKEARSAEFLGLIQQMAITADSATFAQGLGDTLQLARRYNLSAYDASYLELALREGLPLATLDSGLRDAVQRAGVGLFE